MCARWVRCSFLRGRMPDAFKLDTAAHPEPRRGQALPASWTRRRQSAVLSRRRPARHARRDQDQITARRHPRFLRAQLLPPHRRRRNADRRHRSKSNRSRPLPPLCCCGDNLANGAGGPDRAGAVSAARSVYVQGGAAGVCDEALFGGGGTGGEGVSGVCARDAGLAVGSVGILIMLCKAS